VFGLYVDSPEVYSCGGDTRGECHSGIVPWPLRALFLRLDGCCYSRIGTGFTLWNKIGHMFVGRDVVVGPHL
jgi:hypothetical protein